MHRFCPFCRLEYERKQGYFLGAMYFGYGMALALSAPLVLVLLVFGGFSVKEVILTLGGDAYLSCSAAVPLLSNPLDAFRPILGPQVC